MGVNGFVRNIGNAAYIFVVSKKLTKMGLLRGFLSISV